MLQHRHDQPGHPNPGASEKWWHDVNHVHTKYPTAHDHILGTREIDFTPKQKKVKATLSFNEWGEPLTEADVDPNVKLYQAPPEYAVSEAVAEAEAVLAKVPAKR